MVKEEAQFGNVFIVARQKYIVDVMAFKVKSYLCLECFIYAVRDIDNVAVRVFTYTIFFTFKS